MEEERGSNAIPIIILVCGGGFILLLVVAGAFFVFARAEPAAEEDRPVMAPAKVGGEVQVDPPPLPLPQPPLPGGAPPKGEVPDLGTAPRAPQPQPPRP